MQEKHYPKILHLGLVHCFVNVELYGEILCNTPYVETPVFVNINDDCVMPAWRIENGWLRHHVIIKLIYFIWLASVGLVDPWSEGEL